MKPAWLLVGISLAFASAARASHVTVPGDFAAIQPALDSSADTVFVCSGDFVEDLVMARPHALLPAPNNDYGETLLPMVRSLTIDPSGHEWIAAPVAIVRGFRIRGPLELGVNSRSTALILEGCRIDGGLRGGGFGGAGSLHVRYCTIFGGVSVVWNAVDFTMNTVLNGGVSIQHDGYQVVHGNHVQDAPGVGILAKSASYRPEVRNNTVTRCQTGISTSSGGWIVGNVVTDCSGDGFSDGAAGQYTSFLHLNNNRFERCGRGVYVTSSGSNEILSNVVLRSVGDGIAARGTIIGNTIALSGGNGIASAPAIGERFDLPAHSDIARNVSAFNAGFGFLAGNSVHLACNDWFGNGGGATQGIVPAADDIQLDPLFCDLSAGDVRVNATSPLFAAECGPIGAGTVGCGTQVIAASVAPLGSSQISVRGRGAVAQFSLVDSSPATLEVLDL
jgi:hypothetical protein